MEGYGGTEVQSGLMEWSGRDFDDLLMLQAM
jgi:hypothetical protein